MSSKVEPCSHFVLWFDPALVLVTGWSSAVFNTFLLMLLMHLLGCAYELSSHLSGMKSAAVGPYSALLLPMGYIGSQT